MKLLLVTPPLTQLNTPYPATAYLCGYLRRRGLSVAQADPGLTWVLRVLSPAGLGALVQELAVAPTAIKREPAVTHLIARADDIVRLMPLALAFLQGREQGLSHRLAARTLLPEGPRFFQLGPVGHEREYLDFAFGGMGIVDRARYLASLFVEDVADAVRIGVDPHFALARYGEALALSPERLEPLLDELGRERLTARLLRELTLELYERERPDVVGMSIPFPGNVLGALRMAATLKAHAPRLKIVWGGGWVNTELRELCEPRLFDYVDAVTYDDGERPLECLLEHWQGARPRSGLLRTRLLVKDGGVELSSSDAEHDVPFSETAAPTYDGLPIRDYVGLIDLLNPMHRLWSDTRWNKLTVAHGCYWRKCNFCDVTLDYIGRYAELAAKDLVDRIEALVAETGERGFHFVDEAAPPKALRALAEELLRRKVDIAWWGNIRFEKTFTPELCALLSRSGCIAVSGGLEAASNRLLALMNKGVTVEQVARVTKAFAEAGVRVHAYLMYGFPSETEQETVDSLEYVRQLFAQGCLDSAFWHRFSATAHAPIGLDPKAFGIELSPAPRAPFAKNDLPFVDPVGADHAMLGKGLASGVYNYMHGLGLEEDVRHWFEEKVCKATVPRDFVARALAARHNGASKGAR